MSTDRRVVALTGGVGGAKLAHGLYRRLPPGALACIVNTGDDFRHLDLHVSPDIDTLIYTLGGVENPATGWGRRDETWTFMAVLEQLGGPDWFRLGDGDLAFHVERTRRLTAGERLTEVTDHLRRGLGVSAAVLPMADAPVRTIVHTVDAGTLTFQEYFVRHRAQPRVRALEYEGADHAEPPPEVVAALADPGLAAVVLCPSNPLLSVAPLLAVAGMRALLAACRAPVVAVSPLIGGAAVKGPTAKVMDELGIARTPEAIAEGYRGVIDALVIDPSDAASRDRCGLPVLVTPTLMDSTARREALADEVLDFAATLGRG